MFYTQQQINIDARFINNISILNWLIVMLGSIICGKFILTWMKSMWEKEKKKRRKLNDEIIWINFVIHYVKRTTKSILFNFHAL